MDEQARSDPDAKQAAAPDLSALLPLIDRISGVEHEVAAIRQALQVAVGVSPNGDRAEAPTAVEPIQLEPQSLGRAAFGSAAAVVLLLAAHYLTVFVLDLHAVVLRLVSIAIPLPIGIWMTLRRQIWPRFETSVAVSIGLIGVGAMSYVVSAHDATPFLPDSGGEWRETLEYVASIAFAYATGVLISAALQARSGAPNRAGQATLKLAQAISKVTDKAITRGSQYKKHVDLIQAVINGVIMLASGVMALVTGLRSVLK
jgi:hypothetical protein